MAKFFIDRPVFAWVIALRRRVRRQTREITERFLEMCQVGSSNRHRYFLKGRRCCFIGIFGLTSLRLSSYF